MAQSTLSHSTEDLIRECARQYYQDAGSPPGRDEEFWLKAEHDLQEEELPSNDPRTPALASTPETSASSGEELSWFAIR